MIDSSSTDRSSISPKPPTDGINNLSSDTITVDSTTTVKTDNDDTMNEPSSITDDSTQPNYLSSLSFFDLVETIFQKKEDIKQEPTNVKEELMSTATISEENPLLSTKSESETLVNNNSEETETTSD